MKAIKTTYLFTLSLNKYTLDIHRKFPHSLINRDCTFKRLQMINNLDKRQFNTTKPKTAAPSIITVTIKKSKKKKNKIKK